MRVLQRRVVDTFRQIRGRPLLRRPRHPVGLRRILDALEHPSQAGLVERREPFGRDGKFGWCRGLRRNHRRRRHGNAERHHPQRDSHLRHRPIVTRASRGFGARSARARSDRSLRSRRCQRVPRPPIPPRWSRRPDVADGRVGAAAQRRLVGGARRGHRDREERGDVAAAHRHPRRRPRITDCRFERCELSGAVSRKPRWNGWSSSTAACRVPCSRSSAASRPVRRLPNGLRRAPHGCRANVRFESCQLPGADLYAADLAGVRSSTATSRGRRLAGDAGRRELHGSDLADIVGSAALRDVEIDPTQVVAVALAVFDSIGIRVTER